jgi:hypothetical protein
LELFLRTDLRYPKSLKHKTDFHHIFSEARRKRDDPDDDDTKIKASSSEILGLYTLLRHFVELQLKDEPHVHVVPRASFNALCKFVDLIMDLKKGIVESTAEYCEQMEDTYFEFLRLTAAAYGTDHLIPKTFLNHELPKQFHRMGGVFDAFICERVHLRIKKVADRVQNTIDFEMSVLTRVTRAQIYAINHESGLKACCLLGKISRSPLFPGLSIGHTLRWGVTISREDLVFCGYEAGVVDCCFKEDASDMIFVSVTCLERVTTYHKLV